MNAGRIPEAQTAFREALRILQPLAAKPGATAEARDDLATSHLNLGFLLYRQGNPACKPEFLESVRIIKSLLAESPNNSEYQRMLAATYTNLGNFYRDTRQFDEAVAAFQKAFEFHEVLAERFPTVPNYRSELGGTLNNLAMVRLNQGNLTEARQLLERAITHQRAALRVNPQNAIYLEFLSNHYAVLAEVLVRGKQHAAAAQAAVDLAGVRPRNGEDAYDAAGLLVQCMTAAQEDQSLAKPRRDQLSQRYAEQSLNLLREAVKRGFKELERFKKDKELDPLRMRPDFQRLLTELEAKKK
jgi:tetratricopeptide (TPR) repeat protein